jgi:hypothetical protein
VSIGAEALGSPIVHSRHCFNEQSAKTEGKRVHRINRLNAKAMFASTSVALNDTKGVFYY